MRTQQASIKSRLVAMGTGTRKLDEDKVRDIRKRLDNGDSREEIARDYRISATTVSAIKTRSAWAWVDAG